MKPNVCLAPERPWEPNPSTAWSCHDGAHRVPALRRWRLEDQKFKAFLSHIACLRLGMLALDHVLTYQFLAPPRGKNKRNLKGVKG